MWKPKSSWDLDDFVCHFQLSLWSSHPSTSASRPWTPTASLSPGNLHAVQVLLVTISPMKKQEVCLRNLSPDHSQLRPMLWSTVSVARVICVYDHWRVYANSCLTCLSLVVGLKPGTEYVIKIVALQNALRSAPLIGKAKTRKYTKVISFWKGNSYDAVFKRDEFCLPLPPSAGYIPELPK